MANDEEMTYASNICSAIWITSLVIFVGLVLMNRRPEIHEHKGCEEHDHRH